MSLNRERLKDRLATVYAALTVEPVEAGYELTGNGVAVTPSKEGQRIHEKKLLGAIERGVFEDKREYEVPIVTYKPELTTAEARGMKPTRLLGSYRTNYGLSGDTSAERVKTCGSPRRP